MKFLKLKLWILKCLANTGCVMRGRGAIASFPRKTWGAVCIMQLLQHL